MNAVFADTAYWIAITNVQDAMYDRAKSFSLSQKSRVILTTESVLIEYLNYFAAWGPHFRRTAAASVHAIMDSQTVRFVPHSNQVFLVGLNLYRTRPDKDYSLTDCISMETMRSEGLTDALTNDRHFEQEGFRALLRDS